MRLTRNVETDAFDRFVQNYDVGIDEIRNDCRALLKPRYVEADKDDAKNLAREAHVALLEQHGTSCGFQMRVELADGTIKRFRSLEQGWAGAAWDPDAARRKREEQAGIDDCDIDPEEIDLEEA